MTISEAISHHIAARPRGTSWIFGVGKVISVMMNPPYGSRGLVLGPEVLAPVFCAVLVGSAINDRGRLEVPVRRGRKRAPLQRIGFPRIAARRLSFAQA